MPVCMHAGVQAIISGRVHSLSTKLALICIHRLSAKLSMQIHLQPAWGTRSTYRKDIYYWSTPIAKCQKPHSNTRWSSPYSMFFGKQQTKSNKSIGKSISANRLVSRSPKPYKPSWTWQAPCFDQDHQPNYPASKHKLAYHLQDCRPFLNPKPCTPPSRHGITAGP